MKHKLIILFLLLLFNTLEAQKIIVGFYNCENFYDTLNNIGTIDEDFLPTSAKAYTQKRFDIKSSHLAKVIEGLGKMDSAKGISLLGLAEIENKIVLEKLVQEKIIQKYNYKYIHFDSKDLRGVDVALIYNPVYFTPYQTKIFSLSDSSHFTHFTTRDILYVKGQLEQEWVHVLVNHWPSRRGGEKKSSANRIWAASVCKRIMDSIQSRQPNSRFIVMGDFNDNPNNKSLLSLQIDNPFAHLFKNGLGSIAYNDSWSLFDQILLSKSWRSSLLDSGQAFALTSYKPIVYKSFEMTENEGRYQGYPKRTYNGDQFRGGFSDHFPVALIFSVKMAVNPLK